MVFFLNHFVSMILSSKPMLRKAFLYGLVSVFCLDKVFLVFIIIYEEYVSYLCPECRVVVTLSHLPIYEYIRIIFAPYFCYPPILYTTVKGLA